MLRALEMGGNYFLINFLMIDEFNLACLPHHMHAGIIIPTHTSCYLMPLCYVYRSHFLYTYIYAPLYTYSRFQEFIIYIKAARAVLSA